MSKTTHTLRRRGVKCATLCYAILALLILLPTSALASTQSFTTPGTYTWVVPAGVSSLSVQLWGAGGGHELSPSGAGGYTTGTLAVTPGESLTVIVGQQGNEVPSGAYTIGGGGPGAVYDGGNFGAGGGRSAIDYSGTELMTAGGGGGSGTEFSDFVYGGFGGGTIGMSCTSNSPGWMCGGGTQDYGGVGGITCESGNHFLGGSGVCGGGIGPGGGGGWYGGAIGGGGSGYCGGAGVSGCSTTATGAGSHGDGSVTFSYTAAPPSVITNFQADPNPIGQGNTTFLSWAGNNGGYNVDGCYIQGGQWGSATSVPFSNSGTTFSGGISTAAINTPTQYSLYCHNAGGFSSTVYVTVSLSTCTNGLTYSEYPSCTCPQYYSQSGNVCVQTSCPNGLSYTQYPSCSCPANYSQSGSTCVQTSCADGLNFSQYPSCTCPGGYSQSGSTCVQTSCVNGLNFSEYPSCTCPTGEVQSGSVCVTSLPVVNTFSAYPLEVIKNATTPITFSWNVQYPPPTCTISGPSNFTALSIIPTSGVSSSTVGDINILVPSFFTLTCGSSTAQTTIRIIPAYQEK